MHESQTQRSCLQLDVPKQRKIPALWYQPSYIYLAYLYVYIYVSTFHNLILFRISRFTYIIREKNILHIMFALVEKGLHIECIVSVILFEIRDLTI